MFYNDNSSIVINCILGGCINIIIIVFYYIYLFKTKYNIYIAEYGKFFLNIALFYLVFKFFYISHPIFFFGTYIFISFINFVLFFLINTYQ
ncbi:ATP synthase protein I [Candidatus Johnevansia muelleri]|uniref:ATP synthase protein I n=1 Tax=Candidatus Johnevansia muelleri TaxID=1495769 RepID=A0A078KBJ0_9GAMM|nr:ATP synthase protein I [Candidatus Evansia muelleri]